VAFFHPLRVTWAAVGTRAAERDAAWRSRRPSERSPHPTRTSSSLTARRV